MGVEPAIPLFEWHKTNFLTGQFKFLNCALNTSTFPHSDFSSGVATIWYFKNPPDKFFRLVRFHPILSTHHRCVSFFWLSSKARQYATLRARGKPLPTPRIPHLAGPGACLLHRSSSNTSGGKILLEEEPLSSRATNYN